MTSSFQGSSKNQTPNKQTHHITSINKFCYDRESSITWNFQFDMHSLKSFYVHWHACRNQQ